MVFFFSELVAYIYIYIYNFNEFIIYYLGFIYLFIFIFLINMSVRDNLRASRSIPRALKLTTM